MNCIIYARVSTSQQAASGLGISAQLEACQRFAAIRGWIVVGTYVDSGVSGLVEATDRPGMSVAIERARQEEAVLLTYSISRLGRTQGGILRVTEAVAVASATEPVDSTTSMGRAMLGMLAVFAQLERDLASERTKAALGQSAKVAGRRKVSREEAERLVAEHGLRGAARVAGCGVASVKRALGRVG